MAKTATKKQGSASNPRSRAAKRATSPSINVDKSIKETPRAVGTSPQLGISRSSGVIKKKRARPMSRGQRARQEKGLARAETVMDQMEKKVDEAKGRLRKRHTRKALWEDVNEAAIDEHRKSVKGPGRIGTNLEHVEDGNNEPQDREDDIDMGHTGLATAASTITTASPSVTNHDQNGENNQPTGNPTTKVDEADLIT